MVKLTPGSRRKLLRHINEGYSIAELVKAMGVHTRTIDKLIHLDLNIGTEWEAAEQARDDRILAKTTPKTDTRKKNKYHNEFRLMRVIDVREPSTKFNNAREIMAHLADLNGLTLRDLTGQSRAAHVVSVRQLAMYEIRQRLQYTTTQIGRIFGGRDHTTVMHAIKKISASIDRNGAGEELRAA